MVKTIQCFAVLDFNAVARLCSSATLDRMMVFTSTALVILLTSLWRQTPSFPVIWHTGVKPCWWSSAEF